MKVNFYEVKNKDFGFSQAYTNGFDLSKKYTKKYEDHSYKRNQNNKYDLQNNDNTGSKLEILEYYKNFLKEFCLIKFSLRKDLLYQ